MRNRTRRILALGLVLLALPVLLGPGTAQSPDWTGTFRPELLIPALREFFFGAEGHYDAVCRDDNGALSLGLLQWHGARARSLLRRIAARSPAAAEAYLPRELVQALEEPEAAWTHRTVSPTQAACLSALLTPPLGRRVQDELAAEDILGYLDEAWAAGMRSDETAFYYAVICNQFGPAGARSYLARIRETAAAFAAAGSGTQSNRQESGQEGGTQTNGQGSGASAERAGSGDIFTDAAALHRAVCATDYGSAYLSLREKSWDYLAAAPWADVTNPQAEGLAAAVSVQDRPAGELSFYEGLPGALARGSLLCLLP